MVKYKIVYADPPWKWKNYDDDTAHHWCGEHYPLMTLDEIKKIIVYIEKG